ncbi:metalloregulator ArsR/SmtB family transcription factor [Patescibacteria group bacterium]
MYSELFKLQSDLLKSLANPRRLEIIQLLREQELSVTEIYQMLDLPQANVSQHLMVLRDSGIVKTRKDGKQMFYSLAHKNISEASDLLREILIEKNKNTQVADEFALSMTELMPIQSDPVCKMRVSPKTAGFATSYEGNKYYFCASGCLKEFKNNPKKYE